MDLLTATVDLLQTYILQPVSEQFIGIFDMNGRFGVLFLAISYLVALAIYRHRKQTGATAAASYWQFLGGNRVYFHRSALLDYRYYFVRAILKVACVMPVVAVVDPYIFRSADYVGFFTNLWGTRPQLAENAGLMLLYGLGVFLVADFVHYWVHRVFHSRWLWDFHKVHHSAAVLVPATASRIHIVEKIVGKVADGIFIGLYAGIFYYLCGGEISRYTFFGVTYLVFIFNSLAANLRHSHVWLSFGPTVEHFINSPAQHQIHHSAAPKHFNKNFGTNLSIWDWMFGSLYVTQHTPEAITFGLGKRENERFLTVYSLIMTPFSDTVRRLRSRLLPVTGHKPSDTSSPGPA